MTRRRLGGTLRPPQPHVNPASAWRSGICVLAREDGGAACHNRPSSDAASPVAPSRPSRSLRPRSRRWWRRRVGALGGKPPAWRVLVISDRILRQALAARARARLRGPGPRGFVMCAVPEESARRYGDRGRNLYCCKTRPPPSRTSAGRTTSASGALVGAFDEVAAAEPSSSRGWRPSRWFRLAQGGGAGPTRRRPTQEVVLYQARRGTAVRRPVHHSQRERVPCSCVLVAELPLQVALLRQDGSEVEEEETRGMKTAIQTDPASTAKPVKPRAGPRTVGCGRSGRGRSSRARWSARRLTDVPCSGTARSRLPRSRTRQRTARRP